MWLELGVDKPGVINAEPKTNIWINMDQVVRVEFSKESNILTATVITVKPGGSDRSLYKGDDAEIIQNYLKNINVPVKGKNK